MPRPIDDDRINVFEHWESAAAVERCRGSGPGGSGSGDDDQEANLDAEIDQFEIASRTALT